MTTPGRTAPTGALEAAIQEIRGELGDDAVVIARLRDRHLPEGRFFWQTFGQPQRGSAPPRPEPPRLVRRFFSPAIPLGFDSRHLVEAWLLHPVDSRSHIEHLVGPYRLAGGWWTGKTISRDYFYAKDRSGEIWWVYRDRVQRRWFLAGVVE